MLEHAHNMKQYIFIYIKTHKHSVLFRLFLITYLLIRRYNRFAVLACLRSVQNCSRSRTVVCQSAYHLTLGLSRFLCPCGRPKKSLTL